MAIIWGLDLKEMQWGKFKSSYMWSNIYHMRRTKFIVYQLAMIFCVVSESLGTDALSNYTDDQRKLVRESRAAGSPANVSNNDIVGSFSYNIFVGVYVATIFGAAFFFELFWPERRENKAVRTAWRVCSVLACIFALSSALLLTVITATHRAHLHGVLPADMTFSAPLNYSSNGEAIASVVLIWLGWVCTCWSTWIMWKSLSHNAAYGPVAAHLRNTKEGETHPFLAHGNPASASNGAGAAGSSALEHDGRHSTLRKDEEKVASVSSRPGTATRTANGGSSNPTAATAAAAAMGGHEMRERPATNGAGTTGAPSAYQPAAVAGTVPAPYNVEHRVTGPTTTVNGGTTTTTQSTSTTVR